VTGRLALLATLLLSPLATAQLPDQPVSEPEYPPYMPPCPLTSAAAAEDDGGPNAFGGEPELPVHKHRRDCTEGYHNGFLRSDRAFEGFVGPISNPILAKDPRALTEFRFLFVDNYIPPSSPLGGGDFQAYGFQVRAALTDRLSFIADKDGFLSLHPRVGGSRTGALNVAMGLKYAFIRDVENQLLVVGGIQYEPQSGYGNVFQNLGDTMTGFGIIGKQFGCCHVLLNSGYQQALDRNLNSNFCYTSLHLDRKFGFIYPLVEANWFHWTQGGNHGLPPALGEGDGLLNLGTSGVAGNDLVTVAAGVKAVLSPYVTTGIAYETTVSNRQDLLNDRILFEMIFRY
jgi:hypothetical protein